MRVRNDAISAIEHMEDGPQVAAFFDFDGTIVSGFSALAFLREQLLQGKLSRNDIFELASAMAERGFERRSSIAIGFWIWLALVAAQPGVIPA